MSDVNLMRGRKQEAMLAAAARWQQRSVSRESDKAAIASQGPGAADSPVRQARFSARQVILSQAAELKARGALPIFIERKIGPTLDWTVGAPSEVARKAGRPVARIVTSIDPHVQPEGFATGFMISPTLLMTNWHVFPNETLATGTGANFLHEADEHGLQLGLTFAIRPDVFFVSHEPLDFAIVAVAPRALTGEALADLNYIALTEATSKILKGQPIEIIEYPDGGGKKYATQNNQLLDILDEGFLHYATDTLEGSSGAPAFSDSWELVALHHAGIPQVRDGQIVTVDGSPWTEDTSDANVKWVSNEGVRVSTIVQALGKMALADPAKAKILKDLLAGTTDPADDVSQLLAGNMVAPEARRQALNSNPVSIVAGTPDLQGAPSMSATTMNFSGPVTIHVYAPAAVATAAETVEPSKIAAPEKSLRFDPDYDDREGYDPEFLGDGLVVPLPGVAEERQSQMYKQDGEIVVLKYHHYSLAMNKQRRLQMWSAVNVDYDPELRKQSGRAFFGTDRWLPDPRLPIAMQITDADFYKPAGQIDRGHIVRREDSAWGHNAKETEYGNSDTFHLPNCTPQHAAFNRESPGSAYGGRKGLWGGFESYIQKSLQHGDTKACILAGPILASDDPSQDFGPGPVQYPIVFWKVVVVAVQDPGGRSGIRCYGFVLSQKDVVDQFGIEFAPGQYARYQRPLHEIAAMAGIVFDQSLLDADTRPAATPVPTG